MHAANTDRAPCTLAHVTSGDHIVHAGVIIRVVSTPEYDSPRGLWVGAGRLTDRAGGEHYVLLMQGEDERLMVRGWRGWGR